MKRQRRRQNERKTGKRPAVRSGDRHGLERAKLFCLNKYGRENFIGDCEYSLEIEDYYRMHFDVAVEDSPHAFRFFDHLPELKVMVYERPWNKDCELPGANYVRCHDWDCIRELIN